MNDRIKDSRGFGTITKKVMLDPNLSIQAKGLYSVLCVYCGNKETAFPSQALLAEYIGCTPKTIRTWLKELVDKNVIKVIKNKTMSGGFYNTYWVVENNTGYIDKQAESMGSQCSVGNNIGYSASPQQVVEVPPMGSQLPTKNNNTINNINNNIPDKPVVPDKYPLTDYTSIETAFKTTFKSLFNTAYIGKIGKERKNLKLLFQMGVTPDEIISCIEPFLTIEPNNKFWANQRTISALCNNWNHEALKYSKAQAEPMSHQELFGGV